MSASATAADLSFKAPPALSPVVSVYNWTGIYLGANGGYVWGKQDPFNIITDRFDSLSGNISGGTVGGTAGAQLQVGHVVMGLETDLDWANVSGSAAYTPALFGIPLGSTFSANSNIEWIATARARVGYALDNWLLYATGGAALMGSKSTLTTISGVPCDTQTIIGGAPGVLRCSGSHRHVGAVLGAGLEYGFSPNWSAKVEYLYITAASLESTEVSEVRAGINYRFGGN
jgi:outer membrane immunogenic protein